MAREINLVPDVKNEMIKALKLRNLIFFICIVVSIVCVGLVMIFGSIVGGQSIAVENKRNTLTHLSEKLNSYSDLNDFLTIRDQLGNLSTLTDNKTVLSRTFNVLSALLPTGADTITISELNVNLADASPTFSFDAQANAGKDPFIDYNVLDSFKKSMKYMRYDYGNYVDRDGWEIPAYCIIETGDDGATLNDPEKGLYAYWTINAEGCKSEDTKVVTRADLEAEEEERQAENDEESEDTNNSGLTSGLSELLGNSTRTLGNSSSSGSSSSNNSSSSRNSSSSANSSSSSNSQNSDQEEAGEEENLDGAYVAERYDDLDVVQIWRTPQFDEWYDDGYMTESGEISGVAHFDSKCITYSGEQDGRSDQLKWTENNESCNLVPDGDDGIKISDSSNGRGAGDELVLRFSAVIALNTEVYNFNNYHMRAIPPAGRRNVTDSYVQIQAMFGEAARDCAEGDTACSTNTKNLNGGS